MNKKQKIATFSSLTVILLTIVLYLLFSKDPICNKLEIEFVETGNPNIIGKEDVEHIVFSEYKNLIGSSTDNVNLESLESKIEQYPSVKNAEVYKKINGVLGIKIEQRKPILRVFSKSGAGFYIDEEGKLMPLSKKGVIRVLTANGKINYTYSNNNVSVIKDTSVTQIIKELYALSKYIAHDDFYKAQIEQIYITDKKEFELIPLVGNQIILLGDLYHYKKKLEHLKYFYLHYLKELAWKNYKYINLKYKGQIICTKR